MTKRLQFTNTKKWTQDAWFRKLKPEHKLFWLYIHDTCDHAGFWKVDFELAEVCIGAKIEEEILEVFKDKIKVLSDDLWWIIGYCVLQSKKIYREDEKSDPRVSTVNLLKQHGVYEEYVAAFYQTSPGLAKGYKSLKDKDREIDKFPVREQHKSKTEVPLGEKSTNQLLSNVALDEKKKAAFHDARRRH